MVEYIASHPTYIVMTTYTATVLYRIELSPENAVQDVAHYAQRHRSKRTASHVDGDNLSRCLHADTKQTAMESRST